MTEIRHHVPLAGAGSNPVLFGVAQGLSRLFPLTQAPGALSRVVARADHAAARNPQADPVKPTRTDV